MTDKVQATDPTTKVSATVGMEKKAWGTHTVLELKNVKGPLKCSLIAVGKNGERGDRHLLVRPEVGLRHPGRQAPRTPRSRCTSTAARPWTATTSTTSRS